MPTILGRHPCHRIREAQNADRQSGYTYPCPGSQFSWNDLGYIFDSYPFTIHGPDSRHNPGYSILFVDAVASIIRVRAKRCHGVVSVPNGSCVSCLGLGPSIEVRADCVKSLTRARKKIASYKRFFDIVSTNDVPGLSRLLSNSVKEGWGISKTSDMITLAVKGKYHPRNYTDFDKDLAILIYELGGGGALYALNKAPIMLPSRHTIADIRRQHSLRITVGNVTMSAILENIEMLFKNDIEIGEHKRVGITLSQDEIAGDGRLCYLDETDEIAGLCEHAVSELETLKMGTDLESVCKTVKAVRDGRVHIGKEFSVAAFSRHAETDYGAKPVLLMPTCKKGSWQSAAQILQKLIQAWKLSPSAPDDPIYKFLSPLSGLNLYTGDGGLTMDFDYKDLFKRLCTLLCLREGSLVNTVVINKVLLAQWLERLSGHDWSDESIHALLNPKDAQDVGRAVKLLCLVADLRHINTSDFSPSERNTHRAFCILGEMFDALIDPFITPTLSLSDQIVSLVKFAHIACALFVKHDGDFLSHQLYGDLQAMVKNAIFKVAHSKVLNPLLKVFLCLLGDDVLEILFGRSRMIGRHSPNMAIDELRQRFGSALRIDYIFRKHPELERHARRLKLLRSRDVDHLSPREWKGDLTAQSCDLLKCWIAGMEAAVAFLKLHGIDIDFRELFSPEDADLMRPKGGKYPGLSKTVDRSIADATNSASSESTVDGSENPLDAANILSFHCGCKTP
ncbi:hypothetical protein B0H14DRAFT_2621444 [Mycena olivaceomarginata]|nr:hypothetical protein B0H14DRAFT_2621444 [Mycena olivaceomarginata]